jgi:hypothetical protein
MKEDVLKLWEKLDGVATIISRLLKTRSSTRRLEFFRRAVGKSW